VRLAVLGFAPLAAACTAGTITPLGGDTFDEEALVAALPSFHESGEFIPVSSAMYPSVLDSGNVEVYVSAGAAAEFGKITPDRERSGVLVPEGTYVIREVFDTAGAPVRLTAMVKGPPGYSPAVGDWWFAVATADGVEVSRSGLVVECYSCHQARASDSYLFGVPADRR
jgi:hypothetical protein